MEGMRSKMDLVGYLSSGYPSKEETLKNAAAYIEGGCDVLEIDLPTDNPHIDGELIQHRMVNSFTNDPSLRSQANVIREIHKMYPTQRIFLLAYEETIINFGIKSFIQLYRDVEAEALILVATSDHQLKNELMSHKIKIATYVQYHLPAEEIEAAKKTNGFVYLQATPFDENLSKHESLKEVIAHLKEVEGIEAPIYCGVGISTPEDIKQVKEAGAQGAFVGSGLLRKEEDKEELIDYIKQLKQASF